MVAGSFGSSFSLNPVYKYLNQISVGFFFWSGRAKDEAKGNIFIVLVTQSNRNIIKYILAFLHPVAEISVQHTLQM